MGDRPTGYVVDWDAVMRISHRLDRQLWTYAMQNLGKYRVKIDVAGMIKSGIDRDNLRKAFLRLESMNLLRKFKDSWGEVVVNPDIARPREWTGRNLRDARLVFAGLPVPDLDILPGEEPF
jgi:hypothetical protein